MDGQGVGQAWLKGGAQGIAELASLLSVSLHGHPPNYSPPSPSPKGRKIFNINNWDWMAKGCARHG